jgi:hypothetical protein
MLSLNNFQEYQINIILNRKDLNSLLKEEPLVNWSLQFTSYKRNILIIGSTDLIKPLIFSRYANRVYYFSKQEDLEFLKILRSQLELNEIYNFRFVKELQALENISLIFIESLDEGDLQRVLNCIKENNFPNIISKFPLPIEGYEIKKIQSYPDYQLYSDHKYFYKYLEFTSKSEDLEHISWPFLTIERFLLLLEKQRSSDFRKYLECYLDLLKKQLNPANLKSEERLREALIMLLSNRNLNELQKKKVVSLLQEDYFVKENLDTSGYQKLESRLLSYHGKPLYALKDKYFASEFKIYSLEGTLLTLEKEFQPREDLDFSLFENRFLGIKAGKFCNLLLFENIGILTELEEDFKNFRIVKTLKMAKE